MKSAAAPGAPSGPRSASPMLNRADELAAPDDRFGQAVEAVLLRGVYRYRVAGKCDSRGMERVGPSKRNPTGVLCRIRVEGAGRESFSASGLVASADRARGATIPSACFSGRKGSLGSDGSGGKAAVGIVLTGPFDDTYRNPVHSNAGVTHAHGNHIYRSAGKPGLLFGRSCRRPRSLDRAAPRCSRCGDYRRRRIGWIP